MRKRKILYIITSLGLGGAEKLLLSYLKNLDKGKYEFYVICLRDKPNDLFTEMSQYAQVTNLRIRNKFNPIAVFYLLKQFRQIQPDIVHTHLFQPRVYATFAGLFYSRAIFITHKHSIVNPRKHNIFILLEMMCIMMNKRIIAISESVKKSLVKYEFIPERKIFVLPNGIDYPRFSSALSSKEKSINQELIIGTVGRLVREKGINYLLLAMKMILTKFPKVKLDIVGDGPALDELKSLSRKLNISNSVNFFGKFVDVIPFYKKMDFFVLPSVLEGFGIVLLEAMAAGIPVIATNVNGINEVVINMNSGILVPPKNPEAIANAVINLIENPRLCKNLIEGGLKRAKSFDLQNHLMKLDNLYSDLLQIKSRE